jgi:hypothetical protein
VSADRGNQGGRGEIGACPELRTSRQSSPWQRARWGSDVDGETGSGQRRATAAPLWRARSVGEVEKRFCRCANEGGRGERGSGAQVTEGGAVASSMRDVGAESSVRAAREGGYAGTRELTEGAREQRERGSGRTRGESGRADRAGPPGQREGGRNGRARGMGRLGRKAEGNRGAGHFTFFFYFSNCFPFSFYLLQLIQFQICHKFKLAPSSICIKQK